MSGWMNEGVNSCTKTFLGFLSMPEFLFPFICKSGLISAMMKKGVKTTSVPVKTKSAEVKA